MKQLRSLAIGLSAFTLVFIASAVIAAPAHADSITLNSVVTRDVLPPHGNTCVQPSVSLITPYVYDGHLDSFDVTVSDRSYVAVVGEVGDTDISFRYMSRWITPDGQLRVHVDVQPTYSDGPLPVSITLLSAQTGRPVCVTVVNFAITYTSASNPTHSTVGGSTQGSHIPTHHVPTKHPSGTPEEGTGGSVPVPSTTSHTSYCPQKGLFGLWTILVVLYALLLVYVGTAQPPLARRHPGIPTALILVPFIALVTFWYLAPLCRGALWIPLLLLVLAIAALFAAFREEEPAPVAPLLLEKDKDADNKRLPDGKVQRTELPRGEN